MAPNSTTKTKGLFDGEGNCDPRQPAAFYKVKKEGPNTGRFFYRCKRTDGDCDFFLWENEAKRRENEVNEAERITAKTPSKSTKRSFVDYSDTDGDSYSESDRDWAIIKTITKVNNRKLKRILETPRKERRTETKTSPSTGHNAGILPIVDNIFDTPAKSRSTSGLFGHSFGANNSLEPQSFLRPPSKSFTSPPMTPSRRLTSTTLSDDAATILRKNNYLLPQHVQDELLSHLDRHWRQAEDYRLARDTARQNCNRIATELKSLTEKIATLQERVQQLEKEKAMQDEINVSLRSRLEKLIINE